MRHILKAWAIAVPVAFGMLVPLGMVPAARAQSEDSAEKERQLGAIVGETITASRLPEVYADIRRVLRDAYLPSMRDAAKEGGTGKPEYDADIMRNIGTILSLLDYSVRAADEAEPFLNQHRDEMVADFARLQAHYLTMPEIQALGELLNLPAIRKAFNALYAGSRLFTDYTYQELKSYYEMTAWFRDLNINTQNNPLAQPDAKTPSPDLVGKAQSIINDFLRVSRVDEMVERVTRFMKEVQLQSDLIPQEQRQAVRDGLEKFEFFYNLQKSMVLAVGPSALAAFLDRDKLEKLHLLVLAPVTAKSFRLIDEFLREATSFSKEDITSLQKFVDDAKARGLFGERSAEDKARLEAEMKTLAESWRDRVMASLTPETRQGLERSIDEIQKLNKEQQDNDGGDDDVPAPGQRQL